MAMAERYTMKLKDIVAEHELQIVHASKTYETCVVDNWDVSRPSLQLTGFYDYFEPTKIQMLGKMEIAYLNTLGPELLYNRVDNFFRRRPVAIVLCHRVPVLPVIIDAALRYDVNVFSTELSTSAFEAQLILTLRTHMAPRLSIHGVLVEVHGEGMLITGESGIGKSETALELVKRGHRLIADDSVDIRRMNRRDLVGQSPPMIRYLMELRGIGIVDIRRIFGVSSVLESCKIDLVIHFEHWKSGVVYNRLGLEDETTSYLGVKVPLITVPVAPARNLAIILEVAAINNRQKRMGFNAAADLVERHDKTIDNNWNG